MRIVRIDVHGYELRYAHGEYVMSGGRSIASLPSTVVRVETESGVVGWGETCPLGPTYLPASAAGARAALGELAPALLGVDATNFSAVWKAMDGALRGHAYAKAAVDIACWDVLGRFARTPVATLLGGVLAEDFPLYVAIPLGRPQEMVAHVRARQDEGVRRFQLKLGADPREDAARVRAVLKATGEDELVIADANGGWRVHDAAGGGRGRGGPGPGAFGAAVPDARGVPDRARPHDAADGARRGDHRRAGADPRVRRDRGGQPEDRPRRWADPGEADPRPRRPARPALDDRGLLGRRPHDRGGRRAGRLHAAGRAADGVVHERLDAVAHRRPPPALRARPRGGPGRPRPRHRDLPGGARGAAVQRSHRRLTASSSDTRMGRVASGSAPSASTNVNVT